MKNILLFLLSIACFGASAHNAALQGIVLDEATGQALPNASINLLNTGKSTLSDALGCFTLKGLQEDTYTLQITHIGFVPVSISIKADEFNNAPLTIRMKAGSLQLSEVAVSSGRLQDLGRVSEIDFRLRPVRSTQDLLRNVPGLFIAQHAGGGKAEQIFLRGFDADHGTDVHITVDGLPVNMVSHAHGQGYSDLHWVIPETVESFRFGKGPYQADKGDFATAGYVSFKTRDALESNLVKAEAGNFNTYRGLAMLKLPFRENAPRKQSGYLAGEYLYSDGPFDQPQFFNRYNAFGRYTIHLNPDNQLNVSGSYFRSYWDASGQIPERALGAIGRFGAIDPTEGGNTGRANANVQLLSQLKSGATLKNQVYYSRYDFNLYSNFTFFLNDSVNGDQIRQQEHRDIFGYNGSLTRESHIGTKDLTVQYGIGIRHDRINGLQLSHTRARQFLGEYYANGRVRQTNAFAWWNGTLQLSQRWALNAALRYDHFQFRYEDLLSTEPGRQNADAGRFSPKLNVSYTAGKNVRLYLSSGMGFHSNDARVSVAQNGRDILPAAYGADLGIVLKPAGRMLVQAALWGLKLDQEFVYVGDEGIVEPSGQTLRLGADLSLRYQVCSWLYADFDLNYARARALHMPKGDDYIPLAPAFTSIGGISANWKNGLKAAIRYRYIANRPANEVNSVTAKGYFVNDLSLGWSHGKMDLSLSIENLFDVDWNEAQFDTESRLPYESAPVSELHFTPGTPFSIRSGIAFRF